MNPDNEEEQSENFDLWADFEDADLPCKACHGTGIENGDLYNVDDPPCTVCWGTGTI